jgi:sugar lactone lactonase YvrE
MLKLRHRTNDEVFVGDICKMRLVEQTEVDSVWEIEPETADDVRLWPANSRRQRKLTPIDGQVLVSLRTGDHLYVGTRMSAKVTGHTAINTSLSYRIPDDCKVDVDRTLRRH